MKVSDLANPSWAEHEARVIERIFKVREARGMTYKELAAKTGISDQSLWNLANRASTIRLAVAIALCDALDIDLRWLLSTEPLPVVHAVYVL